VVGGISQHGLEQSLHVSRVNVLRFDQNGNQRIRLKPLWTQLTFLCLPKMTPLPLRWMAFGISDTNYKIRRFY
jgi:hypothetical protein